MLPLDHSGGHRDVRLDSEVLKFCEISSITVLFIFPRKTSDEHKRRYKWILQKFLFHKEEIYFIAVTGVTLIN